MRSSFHSHPLVIAGVVLFALLTGCSPESKKSRHLERADKLFAEGTLDGAEIEYLNALRIEPEDAYVAGQLGRIYQAQGRTLRAIEFLRNASDADPDNSNLKSKLGLSLLAIGGATDARRLARESLDSRPANDETILLYVEASTTPEQRAEARRYLEQLSSAGHSQASIALALGMLSLKGNDVASAKDYFLNAVELDPKSSAAHSALGTLYWAEDAPDRAEEHLRIAYELAAPRSPQRLQYPRFKWQSGDAATAKSLLNQITKATPDFLPAWMALAEIALAEERYEDCESAIRRVLTREPVHPDALMLSSQSHARTGKYDRAKADLQRLVELFPRMATAHYHMGRIAVASGDLTGAITSLEKALEANPDLADAVLLLAQLYAETGDLTHASATLQSYIAEHPEDSRAPVLLAGMFIRQDQLNTALEIYRDLEQRHPDNPQFPHLVGVTLLRQDKTAEARQAFEAALARATDAYAPLEQLTNLDLAEGQPARARERIASRMESSPERPELHFLLGRVLAAEGDVAAAERELRKAVELQPGLRPATMLLAELYVKSGREQEALDELRKAVDENPEDVGAWMLSATIHEQRGAYSDASAAYEKILQITPDSIPALNNLAYLYCERLGNLDRAHELALKANNLRPNDPHLNDTFGWILLQKGDLAWATSLLERSASSLPDSAEVAYHLGVAHYLAGAEDKSRQALARALELSPDFGGSSDARERLTILAIDPASAGASQRAQLKARIDSAPNDSIARLRLAAISEHDQKPTEAREYYQSVLQTWPEHVPALIGLARLQAWQLGNLSAGLERAEKAHALAPNDPRISGSLGRMILESGNPERATVLLRRALQQANAAAVIHSSLARAEFALGRLNEAKLAMEDALKAPEPVTDGEAPLFLELLELASEAPDPTAARLRAEAVLRDRPDYSPALWALAVNADRNGDHSAAISGYERLLGEHPKFTPAKVRLATIYAANNSRLADARRLATEARNARPDDPTIVFLLGRIAYLENDYSRAITLLEQSRNRLPNSADVIFHLGMARWHQGDQDEGLPLLQRALELGLPERARLEAEALIARAAEP